MAEACHRDSMHFLHSLSPQNNMYVCMYINTAESKLTTHWDEDESIYFSFIFTGTLYDIYNLLI